MKNIVLIDKSTFQSKYVWQQNDDLLSVIDNIVSSVAICYNKVGHIVCYLERAEFDSFRNSLSREFVMWSTTNTDRHNALPAELTPMCKRWVLYGGIYFMEVV